MTYMLGQKGPFSVLDQRKGSFPSDFGTSLLRTKKRSRSSVKNFIPIFQFQHTSGGPTLHCDLADGEKSRYKYKSIDIVRENGSQQANKRT